jgi:thiol-disulfide isomerase/thioredoxin
VNVWATWCKPCVAEMGMLQTWQGRLAREGRRVDLVFVSADESAADVEKFRKDHPGIDTSLRLDDPDGLPAWLGSLGLDAGAPIPIHVLVDPSGKTRCARAGAVSETDYPAIVELIAK